jgi:hypothetical protein
MDKVQEVIFKELGYKPWKSQREFHEAPARFKFLGAGSRYGKSYCGAMDVICDIMKPGTRGWIVGPSYEQPSKEFRYIHESLVVRLGFKPTRELNVFFTSPGPQTLRFAWGSEVTTKSECNPDSLLGEEIDWLILSEGSRLKESTYDMYLRARIGTRHGRVIVPTTPHGYNWLYKRFYMPFALGDPEYWAKVGIKVIENPKFSMEEYEAAKRELPDDVFREQYDGEFIAWSGLLYKYFSRFTNCISPFAIPGHWPVYVAIDPHPSTPVAVLWLAIDEYETCFLIDELYQPDLTISDVSRILLAKEQKMPVMRYLIDPMAKNIDKLRGQTTSVQMQFRKCGIPCIEANNKFESAWYKIMELLKPRPVFNDPNVMKPRLFVFEGLKNTIEQFQDCTWENEGSGAFHHLDCLKYIINDNPNRAEREEEIEEAKELEREYIESMGSRTGYGT